MVDLYQWQGEGAGLHAGEVHGREPKTSRTMAVTDQAAHRFGDGPDEFIRRQFDPGDLAVVPDSQIAEPQRAKAALGLARSAAALLGVTVWKWGIREARQGAAGLLADGRPSVSGDCPNRRFVPPGIGQRSQHPVVGRGPGAGAVRPFGVVGVLAIGDCVESVLLETAGR